MKNDLLSNSMVGGNHYNDVTGFLWDDTFLLTVSDDCAEELDGSYKVEVIKGLT